jgi:two-component system NtrC family sensor kinase
MNRYTHLHKKIQPNDYPYYRPVWRKVVLILLAAAFIPPLLIGGAIAYYAMTSSGASTVAMLREQLVAHQRAAVVVAALFFVCAVILVATVLSTTGRLVALLESKGQSVRMLDKQLRRTSYLSASMELSLGFFEELKDILANIDVAAKCLAAGGADASSSENRETIAQLTREASRGHQLIQKFLRFVRVDAPVVDDVDLNGLLDDLLAFLHKELERRGIQVVRDYREPLPIVRSDRSKLRQVFQNLLLNAMAALEKGGRIELKTRESSARVTVTVGDDGPGIAATDQEKIFEPFFTTKPQGTGLGLSICRSILDPLEGTLRVESQPGQGAAFTVELPCRMRAQG